MPKLLVSLLMALVVFAPAACSPNATDSGPHGGETSVLFIGNSYLYADDIPGILEVLANNSGHPITTSSLALADHALIDHWNEGDAQQEIQSRRATYVVLQQGWTPAGVCRDTLRLAAQRFAPLIRSAGGTPALFEAWAPASSPEQFPGSIGSFRLAAQDVGGVALPIAEAWQQALASNPDVQLYADDIHPSPEGSYLTALVIYARLTHQSPVGLPSSFRLPSRGSIDIDPNVARELQSVAAAVGLAPGSNEIPPAQPIITSAC